MRNTAMRGNPPPRAVGITFLFLFTIAMLFQPAPATGATTPGQAGEIDGLLDQVDLSGFFANDSRWKDPRVECLIVTSAALAPALQPLADLKTARGVFTRILTLEEIRANATFTGTGSDDAAYIRNAIKYYRDHEGTRWVILGGDVDVIPVRYVYNPDYNYTANQAGEILFSGDYRKLLKPTDQYYAGLNGTWDEDGDGLFGEMNINNAHGIDEADWEADVYVGRLPASTIAEMNLLVGKIVNYETNPPLGDWMNTVILAGAVSQQAVPSLNQPNVDEAELSEFLADEYFQGMNVKRVYHCSDDYQCPSPYIELTSYTLPNEISKGAAIANLAGHGSVDIFSGEGGPPYLTYSSAMSLTNGDKLPLVYIFSCSSGAFDAAELPEGPGKESLAEGLMLAPSGGAIAVISAMRTSYYFQGDDEFRALNRGQNRFFWREFWVNGKFQPGMTLYDSKVTYIQQYLDMYWNIGLNYDPVLAQQENYFIYQEEFRKNLFTYNLLGDPEISIYTTIPRAINDSDVPRAVYAGDTLAFRVTNDLGVPVPGARVLVNGSGYYVFADADADGFVTLRLPRDGALVGQNLTITITGHDLIKYRGDITIQEDTTPPASLFTNIQGNVVFSGDPVSIIATGQDEGSGIKQAFVVFVDGGSLVAIEPMKMVHCEGNMTIFHYQLDDASLEGKSDQFFIIGVDAAGHEIVATSVAGGQYLHQVEIRSPVNDALVTILALVGIPGAAAAIIAWLYVSRRGRGAPAETV